MRTRATERKQGSGWEARVPVECGDTRSSGTGKRDGTRARTKAYRKNPPLFHFTRTSNAFGIAPAVQSPPLRPSIFPLSSRCRFPPRGTSSPFAPYLALSPRIRSSPSISRPLLFLLSICALSGRFEARWKLRDKSWNVRTHTYVPERAHMNATRTHVRV